MRFGNGILNVEISEKGAEYQRYEAGRGLPDVFQFFFPPIIIFSIFAL